MSADSSGTDSASDLSSLEPLSPSSSDSSSSSDDDMGPKAPGAGAHASAGNHKDVLHPSFQVHCDSCGALHRNPRLCDTYRTCHFCFKIHRQPDQLQVTHHVRPTGPLHITAAAYGHATDARRAVDVSAVLQKYVNTKGRGCELLLPADENMVELLGDPAPGYAKQLRLRYAIQGRRAERLAVESESGFLAKPLHINAARGRQPRLKVLKATYGHPHGVIRGRGAFDVTEFLQARVDDGSGDYLEISCDEALKDVFGEPCAGVTKHLVVEYEVLGRAGKVQQLEARGHLQHDVHLISTPCVAPLLLIDRATYGLSDAEVAKRSKLIARELARRDMLRRKKERGLSLTAEENARVQGMPLLRAERDSLAKLHELGGSAVLTVTKDVQRLVDAVNTDLGLGGLARKKRVHVTGDVGAAEGKDKAGGGGNRDIPGGCVGGDGTALKVSTSADLNSWLGDPCPGYGRVFRVEYTIAPLDTCGDASDMTRTGHRKNFIIPKHGVLEVDVAPCGNPRKAMLFEATKVMPVLQVHRASFGHPTNMSKVFDVTSKVQDIVMYQGGYQLKITKDEDIIDYFTDPCRGVRKVLHVGYECLGLAGTMHLEERDGKLQSTLRIGYPGADKGTAVSEVAQRLMTPANRATTPAAPSHR